MNAIDFVVTWVDGNDPAWIASKRQYEIEESRSSSIEANADYRYYDNGLLRYWFRGVESFAPWVRKVFFVTCGQKPSWLNEDHPKISLVNHEDYIPQKYLPTFNSNTIEMNLHRIKDLSEQFVLFNDDIFLLHPIEPCNYFKKDDPILFSSLQYPDYIGYNNWSRFLFNDYCLVNSAFNIRKSIWENRKKWFSLKNLGLKKVSRNIRCYVANWSLPVGIFYHVSLPHLKSSLEDIWRRFPIEMNGSCIHKFRTDDQLNQYLICAWDQARGRFYPAKTGSMGWKVELSSNSVYHAAEIIRNQQTWQICLNDSSKNDNPEECATILRQAFDFILPKKSSFEKD